jgi:hypothetical protein
MSQVLHIANGETLNSKIEAPKNRLARMLENGANDRTIVDDLYLSSLSRPPSSDEERRLLAILDANHEPDATPSGGPNQQTKSRQTPAGAAIRRKAIEDLYWSVLSSKEFLFNH